MKATVLVAVLSSVSFTAAADVKPKRPAVDVNGPAKLVPGTSIGPFRLGMTGTEIKKLGIAFKTPAISVIVTGPYEIVLDRNDRVTSISRRMATDHAGKPIRAGVILNGKTIASNTSFADLTKRIPGCKPPVTLIGGTVARCARHTFVGAAGPVGVVVIGVERR